MPPLIFAETGAPPYFCGNGGAPLLFLLKQGHAPPLSFFFFFAETGRLTVCWCPCTTASFHKVFVPPLLKISGSAPAPPPQGTCRPFQYIVVYQPPSYHVNFVLITQSLRNQPTCAPRCVIQPLAWKLSYFTAITRS